MNNYAQNDNRDNVKMEMLDGKIVFMSPRPSTIHNRVILNLSNIFYNYLKGKTCILFADGEDVYLTKKDKVVPDMMVVCNRNIIKKNGVHGTPDLIVEVLSPSTRKNDLGYKKNLYERCGVKEYWIVEPSAKSIEVYLLRDGKFELDNVYSIYPDWMIEQLTDEEKNEYITEFKTSLYDDLIIKLDDVFYDLLED